MDLRKLNLIKNIIKANPNIEANLDYIKQAVTKNDYEIIINGVGILDILNDDNILCNDIKKFCENNLSEQNIVNYFNKLATCCGITLLGYKLIDKFLNNSFSGSKELYISDIKDKDETFGLATFTKTASTGVFMFSLCDKNTFENYLVGMICKTTDTEPSNMLDAKVTFSLVRAKDSKKALSDEIKIKDFKLDWFKAQELDNKLK